MTITVYVVEKFRCILLYDGTTRDHEMKCQLDLISPKLKLVSLKFDLSRFAR